MSKLTIATSLGVIVAGVLIAAFIMTEGSGTTINAQQTTNPADSPAYFTRNLRLGDSGADVKNLQILLNNIEGIQIAVAGPGSPGNETTYFGSLTERAVIAFQEKYASEILSPWGLTNGTGFVGGTTQQKLNALALGGTQTTDGDMGDAEVPIITSIDPARGANGTRVTLRGKNFSTESNTIMVNHSPPSEHPVVASSDGETLRFTLDTLVGRELEERLDGISSAGLERVKEQFPEELLVQIKVKNENGESNVASFYYTSFVE